MAKVYLSSKLIPHPKASTGAMGCMFVFDDEQKAVDFDGISTVHPVEVLSTDLVRLSVDNVRKTIIKNSRQFLAKPKKKKNNEKPDSL